MIVECSNCGTKNRTPDPPREDGKYKCGSCKALLDIPQTSSTSKHSDPILFSRELITYFIKALSEEIEAIKAGKGGSVVRVFDGQFIRESSGIFVYSFMLENFIATIDDAPVRYKSVVHVTKVKSSRRKV
ncbi:MAG: hypothetical protein AB1478_07485 [Nitrospirota bacterium]